MLNIKAKDNKLNKKTRNSNKAGEIDNIDKNIKNFLIIIKLKILDKVQKLK